MKNTQVAVFALAALLAAMPLIAQVQLIDSEAGWTWQVKPMPASSSSATKGVVLTLNQLKDGSLLLTAAFSQKSSQGVYSFRAVAFDQSSRRYEFDFQGGASSDGVFLKSYRLPSDRLSTEELKLIGIEKLTRDNLRTIVAPGAFSKLKQAGEQGLNYPEIGKSYSFELTTIDGATIRSEDLAGKVVLLDFWASWCTPCMAKMPKLKEIYQKLSSRGFEVIGLNHDNSLEVAKRLNRKEQLPWPLVLAPTGKQARELWNTAAGISALPRLWLIDRKGIMRADIYPDKLEQEIYRLIDE